MPVAISLVLGLFSMGFQLLGSRLLSPWFGSSIEVWAFLISTFLAAFSVGSLVGAWIVRWPEKQKLHGTASILGVGIAGFAFNAGAGRAFLSWIDLNIPQGPMALGLACGFLFFPPVCALAAVTPILIQRQNDSGQMAGYASGIIYAVGTVGNILGIMMTVFLLIPRWPVSGLMWFWTGGIACLSPLIWNCLRAK